MVQILLMTRKDFGCVVSWPVDGLVALAYVLRATVLVQCHVRNLWAIQTNLQLHHHRNSITSALETSNQPVPPAAVPAATGN